MKRFIASAAAVLGLFAMAGTAYSAPVTFKFQNTGADLPLGNFNNTTTLCNGVPVTNGDYCTVDNALGFKYTKSGLSVTAVGNNEAGTGRLLQDLIPNNSGLAVVSPNESGQDDQVQVRTKEFIVFTFDTLVSLLGIDFNAGNDKNCSAPNNTEGPCGDFKLIVDDSSTYSYTAKDNMVFSGISGTSFKIVATGIDGNIEKASGFAIGSITAAVPEPGTLALLGLGLLGVGLMRRRG